MRKEEIAEFAHKLMEDSSTFPYLIGSKIRPDDKLPYSGPFWDEAEIAAMLKSLIYGKWFPSGGEVAKFEAQFSKKFNLL